MTIGKMSEFDLKSGTWSSYTDRLDMYFKVNAIKDELKLPTMIAVMGDEVYELLVNLASPKKPSELKYEEAVELLHNHLQPNPSVLAERYHFRQRRQTSEENTGEYVAELKRMARFCKFSDKLDDNLRDQFVCGLRSDLIRQRLFAEKDADTMTFANAVKLAHSLETAERDAAAVEARSVPVAGEKAGMYALEAGASRARGPRRGGGPRSSAPRGGGSLRHGPAAEGICRGCGAMGHAYGDCRFRECSRCKRPGHLRRMCTAGSGASGAGASRSVARPGAGGSRSLNYGEAAVDVDDCFEASDYDEEEDGIDLHQLCIKDYKAVSLQISIDGKIISMEIDTGTPISCISKKTYDRYFSDTAL